MPEKRSDREKLAITLHGAFKHVVPPSHPQADEWAWDALPSRMQDRWLTVADLVMEKTFRQRVGALVAREAKNGG